MTAAIWLFLAVLLVSVILFSFEWLPVDVTGLAILLVLILTGLLPAKEAFAGFGSDVVVLMLGLLIMTAALSHTGATTLIERWLGQYSGVSPQRMFVVVMIVTVALSAFMSNTASAALLLPVVIGLARRGKISVSRLLMPLAFAAILASSITLVGTSTNIVVSGLMTRSDMEPLGMFELAPVGIPIAVVGVVYMLTLGRRLIPDRAPVDVVDERIRSRIYYSEMVVSAESPWAGMTLADAKIGHDYNVQVMRVIRADGLLRAPGANTVLEANDVLLVEGTREDILRLGESQGVRLKADIASPQAGYGTGSVTLNEVIIIPGSPLIRRTLEGLNFRQQFHLQVLAMNRSGETLTRKMSTIRLKMGDVLLLQGNVDNVSLLENQAYFSVLGTLPGRATNQVPALLSVLIFAGVVIITALNLLPLPVAMLLGAGLVLVTRCITPEEAYKRVQWNVIILIACMLGLGAAMELTGTAAFLAGLITDLLGQAHPVWLLTAFYFMTVGLTQPMSNQSAAVVVFPVAVQTAIQLGLEPRSFAVMIALAASSSFITPLEPACLMVYGPGHYRFTDFVRVGLPLTILIYGISILLVPVLWPV